MSATKPRKKIILRIFGGCAVFLVTVVIILGLVVYFSIRKVIREEMTPAEIAEMERYLEEPIEVPEEWRDVQPFPKEVVSGVEDFTRKWAHVGEKQAEDRWEPIYTKLQTGQDLSPEEWAVAEAVIEEYEGLSDDLTELAAMPGYHIEALPMCQPVIVGRDCVSIPAAAKLMVLESHVRARQGNWAEAFQPCLTLFRISRRDTPSAPIAHFLAMAFESPASRCIARLSLECNDAAILRSVLNQMEQIDPGPKPEVVDNIRLISVVGELRVYARLGHDVDLSSRQTLHELNLQYFEAALRNDPEYQGSSWLKYSHVPIVSRIIGEIIYRMWVPPFADTEARLNALRVMCDLARVAVADRLHQLETGERATDVAQLAREYLSGPLTDPFAEGPYRWRHDRDTFFSVGPDTMEQAENILYDPTNGSATSAGDIYMPYRMQRAVSDTGK